MSVCKEEQDELIGNNSSSGAAFGLFFFFFSNTKSHHHHPPPCTRLNQAWVKAGAGKAPAECWGYAQKQEAVAKLSR